MTDRADTAYTSLKDFQRDTVNYVLRRLYDDPDGTDRFLVADEVGMGKTLVARGVISGAIERLQHDESVDRIDVIYICSNADIARQNIAKLDVRGDGTKPLATRITMLGTQLHDLNRRMDDGSKAVNLVAVTPGTSFEKGHAGGQVRERAFLWWLMEPFRPTRRATRNALVRILRLGVSDQTWDWACRSIAQSEPDESVAQEFRQQLRDSALLFETEALAEELTGIRHFTKEQNRRCARLVSALRQILAEASVSCLEPDLVILDEFQRFKHLLTEPDEGAEREVSQLAHRLFTYPNVKVLLLSATPYKMFTLAEERSLTGDDHYADFLATVDFLGRPRLQDSAAQLKEALADFRRCAVGGADPMAAKTQVESILRTVMCRTERPVSGITDMLAPRLDRPDPPTSDDMLGYVAMKRIAAEVNGPLSVEYWKSAPYFLNFMDGYKLSEKFKEAELDWRTRQSLLKNAQVIRSQTVRGSAPVAITNARLRQLAADTIDRDLWRLLWVSPSMPYHEPSGPYAEIDPAIVTKRLIFSSWAAAPSAIAALLSWNAMLRMQGRGAADGPTRPRLTYSLASDADRRPAGMSTLAIFVPAPGLAALTDPLQAARKSPDRTLTADEVIALTTARVAPSLPTGGMRSSSLSPDTWYWATPFMIDRRTDYLALKDSISESDTASDDRGLIAHLEAADEAGHGGMALGNKPPDLDRWTAMIGLAGPGNVAWRALARVTAGVNGITDEGRREASAVIAAGFRSLFNRPEVMSLLDREIEADTYWQRVLLYCHGGNLQAVMDEYLHHFIGNSNPTTDEQLKRLAEQVRAAISLRTAPIQAFDPYSPDRPFRFNARFALRYGNAKGTVKADEQSAARMADVQTAFNSPFWPMVLASTSVGQEGVDFHWWCHSLVHWNLPANPVDFEQREGRVHRFKGHAIRKNVAAAHRVEALASEETDPWVAAFAVAEALREDGMNDLWPWWTYPGEAKIERWIPAFPLSKDQGREEKLQKQRALYRLAFGQPRQEDLITILEQQGYANDPERLDQLRIDLRPPTLASHRPIP